MHPFPFLVSCFRSSHTLNLLSTVHLPLYLNEQRAKLRYGKYFQLQPFSLRKHQNSVFVWFFCQNNLSVIDSISLFFVHLIPHSSGFYYRKHLVHILHFKTTIWNLSQIACIPSCNKQVGIVKALKL